MALELIDDLKALNTLRIEQPPEQLVAAAATSFASFMRIKKAFEQLNDANSMDRENFDDLNRVVSFMDAVKGASRREGRPAKDYFKNPENIEQFCNLVPGAIAIYRKFSSFNPDSPYLNVSFSNDPAIPAAWRLRIFAGVRPFNLKLRPLAGVT